MKNTKANVIKVLKAQIDNRRHVSATYGARGEEQLADYQRAQACALQSVIWLLTDEDYFNEVANIYKD